MLKENGGPRSHIRRFCHEKNFDSIAVFVEELSAGDLNVGDQWFCPL